MQGGPPGAQVLVVLGSRRGPVVGRLIGLQRGVGNLVGKVQPVAQCPELNLGHLLDLVGGVAGLDLRSERPALDGLGQDHRGRALVLHRRLVGRVELVVVVPPSGQGLQLGVGEVLHHVPQSRVRSEEMLPDERPRLGRVLLVVAVQAGGHLVDQHAVGVPGQQLVPAPAPDHLDDVPPCAPERGFQLLDDLAVPPDRAVQALEVAVDHEGQVVETLACRQGKGSERLGLVHLAVADEAPNPGRRGVREAPMQQVAVESSLVDGTDRPEAHRHGGELPELRHRPRVRVGRQPRPAHLHAEVVQLILG